MKTVFAVAAALGLSVTVASACPMKRDTSASVDKELTVASIPAPISTPVEADTTKDKAE